MSRTLIFWLVMLAWLLNLIGVQFVDKWPAWPSVIGLFLLFLLLGWEVYGAPVKGKNQ